MKRLFHKRRHAIGHFRQGQDLFGHPKGIQDFWPSIWNRRRDCVSLHGRRSGRAPPFLCPGRRGSAGKSPPTGQRHCERRSLTTRKAAFGTARNGLWTRERPSLAKRKATDGRRDGHPPPCRLPPASLSPVVLSYLFAAFCFFNHQPFASDDGISQTRPPEKVLPDRCFRKRAARDSAASGHPRLGRFLHFLIHFLA